MNERYFRWGDSSGPIAVEGGVRAKSKRGAIGEQWWSRRFIAVLESYGAGMSGRLQRGKNYARRGQVIEFSLGGGEGRRPGAGVAPAAVPGDDHGRAADDRAVARGRVAAGGPGAVPRSAAGGRDAGRDRAGLRRRGDPAFPRVGARPDDGLQLPGLGRSVQAPGGGLLRAGRGVRRRPVRDAGVARPDPGRAAGRAARQGDGPGRPALRRPTARPAVSRPTARPWRCCRTWPAGHSRSHWRISGRPA